MPRAFLLSWIASSAICICSVAMAITMFAISGLDIALWDLAARVKGVAAASLDRGKQACADSGLREPASDRNAGGCCRRMPRLPSDAAYTAIKLHETTTPAVFAARQAIGAGVPLMVDMNCPLDGTEAIAFAQACRAASPMFLEEPVWPPEDFATRQRCVQKAGSISLRARMPARSINFAKMMTAGAVSYAQPSVIKVGASRNI